MFPLFQTQIPFKHAWELSTSTSWTLTRNGTERGYNERKQTSKPSKKPDVIHRFARSSKLAQPPLVVSRPISRVSLDKKAVKHQGGERRSLISCSMVRRHGMHMIKNMLLKNSKAWHLMREWNRPNWIDPFGASMMLIDFIAREPSMMLIDFIARMNFL